MKGLTTRMATIIKAKVSKLLDRAEHPGETLDYSYERQLEHLQSVKKGIAGVITAKKRLQMQAQALEQQVERLDGQARQALAHQRDDLARAAVEQKALSRRELRASAVQIEELEHQQAQLVESEKRLRYRLEAFRAERKSSRRSTRLRKHRSESARRPRAWATRWRTSVPPIQRAEDKTATLRARAAAVEELEAAGTVANLTELEPRSEVERELARLDLDGTIETELEQMKAGLLGARRSPCERSRREIGEPQRRRARSSRAEARQSRCGLRHRRRPPDVGGRVRSGRAGGGDGVRGADSRVAGRVRRAAGRD